MKYSKLVLWRAIALESCTRECDFTLNLYRILSMDGVQDVYITENSVNGDIFMDFLYTQLLFVVLEPWSDSYQPIDQT